MTDNIVYRRYSTFGKDVQFNNDALGGRIANIQIDAEKNNISFVPVFGEVLFKNVNSTTCDGDILLKDTPSLTVDNQKVYAVSPGTIIMYPSSTLPIGWLLCNGQTVSKSTYSQLYSYLGDMYGSTVNTFNLPDMTDRCVIQQDSALVPYDTIGKVGGANEILLESRHISNHNHTGTLSDNSYEHSHSYVATSFYQDARDGSPYPEYISGRGQTSGNTSAGNSIISHTHTLSSTTTIYSNNSGSTVSNTKNPINNVYPSQRIKYIIKY
jgi:microcystin-dependent protein